VVSERRTPAAQTAPAAAVKTKVRADKEREPNTLSAVSSHSASR
jgi:hypothetical protein